MNYKHVRLSSIETPIQGSLYSAIVSKKALIKQIKTLRQRIEDEPLGGCRGSLSLDMIRLKDSLGYAKSAEADARAGIEKRANELGLTTQQR